MKIRKYIQTFIITLFVLLILSWSLAASIWGCRWEQEVPVWVKAGYLGMTVLIIIPIMIMMIVTAVRRNKEIDEEDEDDLSQY